MYNLLTFSSKDCKPFVKIPKIKIRTGLVCSFQSHLWLKALRTNPEFRYSNHSPSTRSDLGVSTALNVKLLSRGVRGVHLKRGVVLCMLVHAGVRGRHGPYRLIAVCDVIVLHRGSDVSSGHDALLLLASVKGRTS